MSRALSALCLLSCVASGCGSDFEPGSRIAKLRLLAVRADRPFAAPGERVELEVLVVDPEQRPLVWALGTCTNPAGSTAEACLAALDGPLDAVELEQGRFALDVSEDALSSLSEPARLGSSLGVVLVACPGSLGRGSTSSLPITCRDADGSALPITEFEVGFKRLFVRASDRNENPRIAQVTWDGEPWPADDVKSAEACTASGFDIEGCPERLRHRIRIEAAEAETGVDEHGMPFAEQLIVHAYSTHGIFREGVRTADSPEHLWAPQPLAGEDQARLWFVVRDDRGGVAWTERRVRLR